MSDLPFSRQPLLWARARFRTALAALPVEQRIVFVQRLRGEVGVDELALALGLEARRVRQVLFHAMRQMREDLAETEDGEDDNAWLARCRVLVEDERAVADLAPPLQVRHPAAKDSTPEPESVLETIREAAATQDTSWLFPGLEVVTRETAAITEADIVQAQASHEPALDSTSAAPASPEPPAFFDPATAYVPSARLRLPPAPPRSKGSGWKWMVVLAVLALVAAWFWRSRAPSMPSPPVPAIATSPQAEPFVPVPASPPLLTSADLPMLALEQAEPGLLDHLPMLIWLAEAGAPEAITAPPAAAEPVSLAVPEWQNLLPEQRHLLAAWVQTWPRLPDTARHQLILNAQLWLTLDAAQRQHLTEHVVAWDALPAADRPAPRARFDAWQQLGPEGRASARAAAAWLAQLPQERQQAFIARFEALPPDQQSRFLRDTATREVFDTIDAAFPFVPEGARAATLALVRTLEPAARTALREQAKRLSPQQREALRKKLLALPVDARAAAITR